jgi:DNA-binding transcriptional LysR family regulator
VTLDIQNRYYDEVIAALYERECDIAITYDAPDDLRLESGQLCDCAMGLLFPPDRDLPVDAVTLDALAGETFIGPDERGPLGYLFWRGAESAQVEIKAQISVRTAPTAAALVRFGAGVAAVDEFTAREFAEFGLQFRPIAPPIRFQLHYICLAGRPPSAALSQFIAELQRTASFLSAG